MNKEQHLTYELGITNVPSDATCDDNGLEESVGMVYADGEHRVVQDFVNSGITMGQGDTLLFVHRFGNRNRYIYKTSSTISWKDGNSHSGNLITDLTKVAAMPQITAIGKTLIINGTDATYYFLGDWTANNYSSAFINLPVPKLTFTFGDDEEEVTEWQTEGALYSNLWYNWKEFDYADQIKENDVFRDGAIGAYFSNLSKHYHDKRFVLPFTIRYALELYTGDYTYISDPILMFPSYSENSWGWDYGDNATHLTTLGRKLRVKNEAPISDDWSDVIKGIAIFVSPFVNIYDTAEKEQYIRWIPQYGMVTDKMAKENGVSGSAAMSYREYLQNVDYSPPHTAPIDVAYEDCHFHLYNKRQWSDIAKELMNNGNFYKLCSIKKGEYTDTDTDLSDKITPDLLEHITTSEQLKVDDYYSRTNTRGDFISVYNQRLIMAGLHRGFFEGFDQFIRYEYQNASMYAAFVYIKTDEGERVIKKVYESKEEQGKYFYYPDPRAYKVRIYSVSTDSATSGTLLYEIDLTEHPGLNGAYYLQEQSILTYPTPIGTQEDLPQAVTGQEYLGNQLAMSEVNNPMSFYASGYTTVGNGEIKGISTITQALSQGQFGQYPLLIFATDGVWAGKIADTGYIAAVQPMSREVISEGTERSLTQTDGAVFFVTDKGLMMVVGNDVRCVSEQLSGKDSNRFKALLKTSMIAYDYRDSLLWICPENEEWCYVYSMKSGTFGKKEYNGTVTNIVNYYPDSLIQIGATVYSLMNRPDINDDTKDDYEATLITRAMKLGDGLTLKSIMRMRNIYELNDNGSLSVSIFAKNDLNSAWRELTHLRGTPWKYYQLRYNFTNLKATDNFAGTVLLTQERRTNKLR